MPKDKMTLEEARKLVDKEIEKGGVVSLEGESSEIVDVISTGCFLVDKATSVGGFPRGRIIELYGMPSSGKTTLLLSAVGQAQKGIDLPVLYLDYEHAFDKKYARLLGVDISKEKLILSQPESFENGMKIAELYIVNNLVSMVVFDSLAAMVPQKELEGEVGQAHVALQARAMAQELRRLTGMVKKSNVCVVFINHLRDVIGGVKFVKRRKTPGGLSLKFYASMRLELIIVDSIKGKVVDLVSGKPMQGVSAAKVKCVIVKNKLGPPFRIGYFYLWFGDGISEMRMAVDVLVAHKHILQNGSRFTIPENITLEEKTFTANGFARLLGYLHEEPARGEAAIKLAKELIEGGADGEDADFGIDAPGGEFEGEDSDLDDELR